MYMVSVKAAAKVLNPDPYNAYLRLPEMLWDALGEGFETGNKGRFSIDHNLVDHE